MAADGRRALTRPAKSIGHSPKYQKCNFGGRMTACRSVMPGKPAARTSLSCGTSFRAAPARLCRPPTHGPKRCPSRVLMSHHCRYLADSFRIIDAVIDWRTCATSRQGASFDGRYNSLNKKVP
jgi:hypothetical protein